MISKLDMGHRGLKFYKVCITDDIGLTYLTVMLALVSRSFILAKLFEVIEWENAQSKLNVYVNIKFEPKGCFLPLPRGYSHVYYDHYFQTSSFF